MDDRFPSDLIATLDETEEVDIETRSPATGERHRAIIWIVTHDGEAYVRSVRGARGRWYRELVANPVAGLVVGATRHGVRALPAADVASVQRVNEALERKYGRSRASTDGMLQPDTLLTTLRLIPDSRSHTPGRRELATRGYGLTVGYSRAWSVALAVAYGLLRLLDPLLRAWWQMAGLGITSRLVVVGRRSGRPRSVLIGLLSVDGRWYVGHPNGEVGWTYNLAAADRALVQRWHAVPIEVHPVLLGNGPERDAAIRSTSSQQPFPGNLMYAAAQRHIRAAGVYFRLDPIS